MVYATEQYEIENASEREPTNSDTEDGFDNEINRLDLNAFLQSEAFIAWKNTASSIHEAALMGRIDIIQKFIENGTSVNLKNGDGWTPLMFAAWKGDIKTVKYLVEQTASIEEKTLDGRMAIDHAEYNGHTDVADFLKLKLH